jgi:hypothetical protein
MNVQHVKKILGNFSRTDTIRLSSISGEKNWHDSRRFCSDGSKPLPYTFNNVNLKQMEIFRTAKELQQLGVLKIVYNKGENWFVRENWTTEFYNLTFLDVEVNSD